MKNLEEPYPFAKINHKIKLVEYTDDEYNKHLKNLHRNWTKEETKYLWDMCSQYDLNFIVIHDRYDSKYQRTVEELKDRYYSWAKKLWEAKKDLEHPVVKKPYNYDYEVKRKYYLEKLYMRSKQQHEKEKQIVDYIKKLEQKIKKLDKEEKNLEKILNEDKNGNLLRKQDDTDSKKENVAGPYLRSQRLLAPIPVSTKVQQQMEIIFKELEIDPTKLNPTEKVITLYDDIRKEILKMLSLHKHIKKRKEEIKLNDERLKDLDDFTKIVTINQPLAPKPPQIRPQNPVPNQPQIAPNPPQIRPLPQPPAAQDQPMLAVPQPSAKPKSPSKDSRSSKPSGKKRKGGAGGSQGGAAKRQRNA